MRMSLERKAARINPPRCAACTSMRLPTSLTRTPSSAAFSFEQRRQPAEHADAEVVEDAAVRERLPSELAAAGADVATRQLQGGKEPGKRRRRGDGHRHGRQADAQAVDFRAARFLLHHPQAVAVERAKASFAEVGGEDVQLRPLRQLEQALVAIKECLVLVFQPAGSRQLTVRQTQQPTRPTQEQPQRKPPHDAIADVQTDEREQFRRRLVEFVRRAVVLAPIQRQVRGHDAAAGHRRDVRDLRQDAAVAQEADQTEMIKGRAKASAGQGETDLLHEWLDEMGAKRTRGRRDSENRFVMRVQSAQRRKSLIADDSVSQKWTPAASAESSFGRFPSKLKPFIMRSRFIRNIRHSREAEATIARSLKPKSARRSQGICARLSARCVRAMGFVASAHYPYIQKAEHRLFGTRSRIHKTYEDISCPSHGRHF